MMMKGVMMAIIVLGAAAVASSGAYAAEEPARLYAGTAKVDITPAEEDAVNLSNRKLTIEDERIYARVLVLKNDETSLAIVSLDLILFSSAKVVAAAREKWGVGHVILSCTHTHSSMAPDGLRIGGPGQPGWTRMGDPGVLKDWPALSEDPWYAATEEKIVAAIGEAMGNLFPARIAAKTQPYENPYMASNRLYTTPDGKGHNRWGNYSRVPTEPRDPTIRVIRVEDEAGKARALLVHYACHPVLLMRANFLSRDYPGVMADTIEKELGPDCMAMFLQGAAGDQDPYDLHRYKGEELLDAVRQSGTTLAQEALRVSKAMPSPEAEVTAMRIEEAMVPVAYRNGKGATEACVTTILINNDLALVTMPGELLVQHQLNLSAKSPVPNTLLVGYAYSGRGCPFLIYVPTEEIAKAGGYSATECVFVEGAAGKKLVNEALSCISALVKR